MYDITKVANRFWERMTELYGTTWANKFGDEPTQSWMEVLGMYDPEIISRAIKGIIRDYPDFPPSLPAFIKLLKSQQPTTQDYLASLPAPDEPHTLEQKEIAHKALEAAKPSTRKARRSVLIAGEGMGEFQDALGEAMTQGMTEKEFRHSRLLANGWTDEKEEKFFDHLQSLGIAWRMAQ